MHHAGADVDVRVQYSAAIGSGGVSYQAGLFERVPASLDCALQERSVRDI